MENRKVLHASFESVIDCQHYTGNQATPLYAAYIRLFLTSVAEKTKTQTQNSSQKLKEKNLNLREALSSF